MGLFIFTLIRLSINIFRCERSASVERLQEVNKIDLLICIFLDPFLGLVFVVPEFFCFLLRIPTSRSSPELMERAPPPEESPDGAVEDEGVGLLDLAESSLLDSCKRGSMLLPLGSKARTVTILSPSNRQQSISPSRKFKHRANELQPEPRKIKRELLTSKST